MDGAQGGYKCSHVTGDCLEGCSKRKELRVIENAIKIILIGTDVERIAVEDFTH